MVARPLNVFSIIAHDIIEMRALRRVAEVFGRVFVLTGIFIKGVIKYERQRREPLGGSGGMSPQNTLKVRSNPSNPHLLRAWRFNWSRITSYLAIITPREVIIILNH